ncbi:MAG: pirin family protein [Bacteroidota bacterium]
MSNILNIEPLGFPWKTQDPFLFCAYHRDEYPQGDGRMGVETKYLSGRHIGQDFDPRNSWRMYHGTQIPGFPYHPHRGFETITINKEGVVDHSDSLGAAGRFMAGDVQWMTAGKGLQHSEMFPLVHNHQDNPLEIFQIWLNLPRVSKMVEPHFKMLWREDIPTLEHADAQGNRTTVQVIAGTLDGIKAPATTPDSWAANPANAVGVFTAQLAPEATWTLSPTQAGASRTFFFYKGQSVIMDGKPVAVGSLVEAKSDAHIEIQNGAEEARFLILEGKPINEPVVQHGPFVMNTQEEIREAMRDYGQTQFGGWPWPEREVVHPQEKGRFALHSDGREEIK